MRFNSHKGKKIHHLGVNFPQFSIPEEIIWEQFSDPTINRQLRTHDKCEIILEEELNNQEVIESYTPDRLNDNRRSSNPLLNQSQNK